MEEVWLALQSSAFGDAARHWVWLYPAANVTHVLAVMSLFGLVAAMDLALLGLAPPAAAQRTVARLRPIALVVLALIASSGTVLLAAEAVSIAANPAFQVKAMAIVLALANVGANAVAASRGNGPAVQITAAASLALWLAVAALGRLIAYF